MIYWFVSTLASVGEIAEYAAAHLQRLEDAGKPAGKFTYTFWPWMNSLKAFFFSSGRRLSSSNCSFIVYCKRSSASPTSFCWHVYAQPSRTITNWTNREARKKHRYQKRLSEKLTYFLATLLDIRTSSYALNHIQTITMVYAIRGPAGTLTKAIIYYFVWKGSFFVMF